MRKHTPENERIKRKYLIFLEHAKQQNVASIDAVAKALLRFEEHTRFKNFKAFHFEQAVSFKKYLGKQISKQTGKSLSKATMNSTLRYLKTFFQWLSQQTGYVSKLTYTDMEYFNLSEKDVRIATAKRIKPAPTVEQIVHVLRSMDVETDIQKRDRALIAFTALTGARDAAIASMKVKHIDLSNGLVFQDAREVKTKFSKSFTSHFFPVDDGFVKSIVVDWVEYLLNDLLFCGSDPLFPKTKMIRSEQRMFRAEGLLRTHWANANPVRAIFKKAFENAGLEYFNPHSFRKTLALLGQRICSSPEEMKVWSQSLGHSDVMTTFNSYGEVSPERESEVFNVLRASRGDNDSVSELAALSSKLDQLLNFQKDSH